MIAILTNSNREAGLLAALCDQQAWPCQSCATVSGFTKLAEKVGPRVVVTRQRMGDGYSDDVLAWLKSSGRQTGVRVIVLVPPDCSIRMEARQIALGADCVLRDPLRIEVLLAYLAKYRTKGGKTPSSPPQIGFDFAGAKALTHERMLIRAGRKIQVTPQEIELLRLLHDSAGKVISYPVLYNELFNQKFRGDTANCRVLLAKAAGSFSQLKIDLRAYITVIPKSGYLYAPRPIVGRIPA